MFVNSVEKSCSLVFLHYFADVFQGIVLYEKNNGICFLDSNVIQLNISLHHTMSKIILEFMHFTLVVFEK